MVLLCLVYLFLENQKKSLVKTLSQPALMSTIVLVVLALTLTATYLIRLPHLASSQRIGEFSLLNQPQIAEDVNAERQRTINNPLIKIFGNKYSTAVHGMIDRFILSFDLTALFIKGNDAVDTYTVTSYGFLHLLDACLLIVGFIFLVTTKKFRSSAVFIFGYILMGTIPNVLRLGALWITFRGSFVILGLILLAGIGSFYLLRNKSRNLQYILIGVYIAFTVPFFYTYFFQFPITATRSSYFFERVLASYVKRNTDKSLLIIADQPRATLESIVIYNDLLNKSTAPQLYQTTTQRNMIFKNLTILNDCANQPLIQNSTGSAVIAVDYRKEPCGIATLKPIEISSPIDSGTKYYVYNDTLCKQYNLPYYINIKTNTFNIESLSDQEFCQSFFTDKN